MNFVLVQKQIFKNRFFEEINFLTNFCNFYKGGGHHFFQKFENLKIILLRMPFDRQFNDEFSDV
ncbi:hypothetical protein M5D96_011336 [Drosophila gunungcola]|uniref:Uncharacterized protein n=1 Tax=Drosophila gunungcola TaxID=103775 RepID=A0A9P9YFC0_9MUSC|nr:hypothetical protein M5D96_011336 [Drosophila gunungcola]